MDFAQHKGVRDRWIVGREVTDSHAAPGKAILSGATMRIALEART
jgi:hypothetical protein